MSGGDAMGKTISARYNIGKAVAFHGSAKVKSTNSLLFIYVIQGRFLGAPRLSETGLHLIPNRVELL